MKKLIALIMTLLLLIFAVYFLQMEAPEQISDTPDKCITCHQDSNTPSPSHPVAVLGCASCHLGNGNSTDMDVAHKGMVLNPANVHYAQKTCGQSNCHKDLSHDVMHSIMYTNSGLIASTMYQWEELPTPDNAGFTMEFAPPDTSLATSHIRKMCSGCHINKPENDVAGEIGTRGGGCNDCHAVGTKKAGIDHREWSVIMPIATCEKCHNRSNRTAVSYSGKYEADGYGTPYEAGRLSRKRLSGGRHYLQIPGDAHFDAGMTCIDCHNGQDLMGDGERKAHLEDAVSLRCETCHQPRFGKPGQDDITYKLLQVNKNLIPAPDSLYAIVSRDNFLSNVLRVKGQPTLIRKADGQQLPIPALAENFCTGFAEHDQLSCQSCHSAQLPQCYGCHDTYDPTGEQLDRVSMQRTKGRWTEGRSYLRFEDPPLLRDQGGRVLPAGPGCQVFLTELDENNAIRQQKTWLTFAAFAPHTTRKDVPGCTDCHLNPKRLGLGEGRIDFAEGTPRMMPAYHSQMSGLGNTPLETVGDFSGQPQQKLSRLRESIFSRDELKDLLTSGYCSVCHDSYGDPVYQNYSQSLAQWKEGKALNCTGTRQTNTKLAKARKQP
jgi:hypothetical protein